MRVLVLGLLLLLPGALRAEGVAVILSKNLKAYQRALKGFEQEFSKEYSVFNLSPGRSKNEKVVRNIRSGNFDLIVAFGSSAAKLAKDRFGKMPIAFCMVVDPQALGLMGVSNIAGISFMPSAYKQLEISKRYVPHARRIGIIYSPTNSKELIRQAKKAAKKFNVDIVGIEAATRRNIPAAITRLQDSKVDLFWMIPDPVVVSNSIVRRLLTVSRQEGIAVLAPSATFVKEGALLSISTDYVAQGREVSQIAARILGGESPAKIGMREPQGTIIGLNLKTAKAIGIKIPESLISNADVVIRNGP